MGGQKREAFSSPFYTVERDRVSDIYIYIYIYAHTYIYLIIAESKNTSLSNNGFCHMISKKKSSEVFGSSSATL